MLTSQRVRRSSGTTTHGQNGNSNVLAAGTLKDNFLYFTVGKRTPTDHR